VNLVKIPVFFPVLFSVQLRADFLYIRKKMFLCVNYDIFITINYLWREKMQNFINQLQALYVLIDDLIIVNAPIAEIVMQIFSSNNKPVPKDLVSAISNKDGNAIKNALLKFINKLKQITGQENNTSTKTQPVKKKTVNNKELAKKGIQS
jgi:hypothetical protein